MHISTTCLRATEIEGLRSALQKLAHPEWGEYRSDEQIVQGGKSSPRCAEGNVMTEKEGTLRMQPLLSDTPVKDGASPLTW